MGGCQLLRMRILTGTNFDWIPEHLGKTQNLKLTAGTWSTRTQTPQQWQHLRVLSDIAGGLTNTDGNTTVRSLIQTTVVSLRVSNLTTLLGK